MRYISDYDCKALAEHIVELSEKCNKFWDDRE